MAGVVVGGVGAHHANGGSDGLLRSLSYRKKINKK